MRRFTLDPTNPPTLSPAERARFDAMTEAGITAAAQADPDNPPLSEDELARVAAPRRVRSGRVYTGG